MGIDLIKTPICPRTGKEDICVLTYYESGLDKVFNMDYSEFNNKFFNENDNKKVIEKLNKTLRDREVKTITETSLSNATEIPVSSKVDDLKPTYKTSDSQKIYGAYHTTPNSTGRNRKKSNELFKSVFNKELRSFEPVLTQPQNLQKQSKNRFTASGETSFSEKIDVRKKNAEPTAAFNANIMPPLRQKKSKGILETLFNRRVFIETAKSIFSFLIDLFNGILILKKGA